MANEKIDIQKLVSQQISQTYPNIVITTPNQTLPVIVRCLEKGDMQLIIEMNGMRKAVSPISPSAYNINMLLRSQSKLTYNKSPDESFEIHSVEEYLNCIS